MNNMLSTYQQKHSYGQSFLLKIGLTFCICISYCFSVVGQDLKSDIVKISAYQKELVNYSGRITYTKYSGLGEKPEESTTVIKKNGVKMVCDTEEFSMIMNTGYTVVLDKIEKTIVCNKNNLGAVSPEELFMGQDFSESDFSGIEFGGIKNGEKKYTYVPETGFIAKVEIFLKEELTSFSKMIYYYKSEDSGSNQGENISKAIISFEILDINVNWPKFTFSGKKYIQMDGSLISLTPRYANYRLILGQGFEYAKSK